MEHVNLIDRLTYCLHRVQVFENKAFASLIVKPDESIHEVGNDKSVVQQKRWRWQV